MKLIIEYILFLTFISALYSEEYSDSAEYSYDIFDDMDETDENYSYDYRHGWFPQPLENMVIVSGAFILGDTQDFAKNIASNSFALAEKPFSSDIPASSREREIMFANKNESDTSGFPQTSYISFGLGVHFTSGKAPGIGFFTMGIDFCNGLLFSKDESKEYLSYLGYKKRFKELGVMHLSEKVLKMQAGYELPVYGVFFSQEDMQIISYYYLSASIGLSYAALSDAAQYMQIADAKSALRYSNGMDTVRLMSKETLTGLNRFRYDIGLEAGWRFIVENFGFNIALYCSLPMRSVIDDAQWLQYRYGLKVALNTFSLY